MYTCNKCDKPFNSKSSHDRHIRYCGSRVRLRQRSCHACAAAKTKCSFGLPCSRCSRKVIECAYSASASGHVEALDQVTGAETNQSWFALDLSSVQDINREVGQDLFTDYGDPQQVIDTDNGNSGQHMTSVGVGSLSSNKADWQQPAWCTWAQQGLSLAAVSGNGSAAVKSIHGVKHGQDAAQLNADLLIQSFRAFPTMMLRKETWPWFIHPHSHLLANTNTSKLPDALSACMGIAQMYILGTSDSMPFVWRSIAIECNRFAQTMHLMSRSELLAAVQACMIYLVMCIIEGSSENDKVAVDLLQVLGDMYVFNKISSGGKTCQTEQALTSSNWVDWIFAESQRRLACLWLLVGCVIRVRTNSVPDHTQSYRDLPLPGPRCLWEASSEPVWRMEYEASRILQVSGLVCLGDLIDAQNSTNTQIGARKLDIWNASVDNLGLLLNLVHTMA